MRAAVASKHRTSSLADVIANANLERPCSTCGQRDHVTDPAQKSPLSLDRLRVA